MNLSTLFVALAIAQDATGGAGGARWDLALGYLLGLLIVVIFIGRGIARALGGKRPASGPEAGSPKPGPTSARAGLSLPAKVGLGCLAAGLFSVVLVVAAGVILGSIAGRNRQSSPPPRRATAPQSSPAPGTRAAVPTPSSKKGGIPRGMADLHFDQATAKCDKKRREVVWTITLNNRSRTTTYRQVRYSTSYSGGRKSLTNEGTFQAAVPPSFRGYVTFHDPVAPPRGTQRCGLIILGAD